MIDIARLSPFSTQYFPRLVTSFQLTKQFNDVWVDEKPWDGIDEDEVLKAVVTAILGLQKRQTTLRNWATKGDIPEPVRHLFDIIARLNEHHSKYSAQHHPSHQFQHTVGV